MLLLLLCVGFVFLLRSCRDAKGEASPGRARYMTPSFGLTGAPIANQVFDQNLFFQDESSLPSNSDDRDHSYQAVDYAAMGGGAAHTVAAEPPQDEYTAVDYAAMDGGTATKKAAAPPQYRAPPQEEYTAVDYAAMDDASPLDEQPAARPEPSSVANYGVWISKIGGDPSMYQQPAPVANEPAEYAPPEGDMYEQPVPGGDVYEQPVPGGDMYEQPVPVANEPVEHAAPDGDMYEMAEYDTCERPTVVAKVKDPTDDDSSLSSMGDMYEQSTPIANEPVEYASSEYERFKPVAEYVATCRRKPFREVVDDDDDDDDDDYEYAPAAPQPTRRRRKTDPDDDNDEYAPAVPQPTRRRRKTDPDDAPLLKSANRHENNDDYEYTPAEPQPTRRRRKTDPDDAPLPKSTSHTTQAAQADMLKSASYTSAVKGQPEFAAKDRRIQGEQEVDHSYVEPRTPKPTTRDDNDGDDMDDNDDDDNFYPHALGADPGSAQSVPVANAPAAQAHDYEYSAAPMLDAPEYATTPLTSPQSSPYHTLQAPHKTYRRLGPPQQERSTVRFKEAESPAVRNVQFKEAEGPAVRNVQFEEAESPAVRNIQLGEAEGPAVRNVQFEEAEKDDMPVSRMVTDWVTPAVKNVRFKETENVAAELGGIEVPPVVIINEDGPSSIHGVAPDYAQPVPAAEHGGIEVPTVIILNEDGPSSIYGVAPAYAQPVNPAAEHGEIEVPTVVILNEDGPSSIYGVAPAYAKPVPQVKAKRQALPAYTQPVPQVKAKRKTPPALPAYSAPTAAESDDGDGDDDEYGVVVRGHSIGMTPTYAVPTYAAVPAYDADDGPAAVDPPLPAIPPQVRTGST